ncbi:hypothetical protein DID88_007213 [Monilinia fructigena]|uniref:Major facilitator superfamily (MFS) profile domain-containing protein n=1 Tax=Monilinia fructigena TaxID=38457 RepID=A0A395J7L5_9HELO|nr:hypothetical protein DID88_007213 [Monilinia fructigena]
MAAPVDPATRKKVLKVVFFSLLLDLLLEFYRNLEAPTAFSSSSESPTLLAHILTYLNTYKASFAKPIDSRYDIVLLGGALGSLFSLLQALASPIIGTLSDKYGRRTALLASMTGNILSVLLWVCATDFRTFLLSRVVGGLSEGNVQLAIAIATDISDEKQRGATMALVGICFSISFTFGLLSVLGSVQSVLKVAQAKLSGEPVATNGVTKATGSSAKKTQAKTVSASTDGQHSLAITTATVVTGLNALSSFEQARMKEVASLVIYAVGASLEEVGAIVIHKCLLVGGQRSAYSMEDWDLWACHS